jgi:hypothetical protein
MFNSFEIPRMQRAIPFLFMIKIQLRCGVQQIPSAKMIGAPTRMFTGSGSPPYPSSNKPFTGPFRYAKSLQVPVLLLSQCSENTMVTTWLSGYSSEHLCRYCPAALTAGFDSKVVVISSSSDHCTNLFRTAHPNINWFDTPCR